MSSISFSLNLKSAGTLFFVKVFCKTEVFQTAVLHKSVLSAKDSYLLKRGLKGSTPIENNSISNAVVVDISHLNQQLFAG